MKRSFALLTLLAAGLTATAQTTPTTGTTNSGTNTSGSMNSGTRTSGSMNSGTTNGTRTGQDKMKSNGSKTKAHTSEGKMKVKPTNGSVR